MSTVLDTPCWMSTEAFFSSEVDLKHQKRKKNIKTQTLQKFLNKVFIQSRILLSAGDETFAKLLCSLYLGFFWHNELTNDYKWQYTVSFEEDY